MTLDAYIGQNGIKQVEEFNKYLPINNIILNLQQLELKKVKHITRRILMRFNANKNKER